MKSTQYKNLLEEHKSGAEEFAVIEGLHAIKHALRFGAIPKFILVENRGELDNLIQRLCPDIKLKLASLEDSQDLENSEDAIIEVCSDFQKITDSKIRTGIIGLFKKPASSIQDYKAELKLKPKNDSNSAVLIDNPKDLNNLGAIVRICAAAGIQTLITIGELNIWNSRAIRAGAGLQFALSCINLKESEIINLKAPLICFDERGQELNLSLKSEIQKMNKEESGIVYVFGSERDGISAELKKSATKIVRLPMQDGVSSLNLATSVSATLYTLKI
jgi:TrmH family RNA methyltransferase